MFWLVHRIIYVRCPFKWIFFWRNGIRIFSPLSWSPSQITNERQFFVRLSGSPPKRRPLVNWKTKQASFFFYIKILSTCPLSLVASTSHRFHFFASVHLLTMKFSQWARECSCNYCKLSTVSLANSPLFVLGNQHQINEAWVVCKCTFAVLF